MSYYGHPDQNFGHLTYSQNGEDLVVLNIFKLLNIPLHLVTYLDLGAHHPTDISNTKLLYDFGCRGVNVEANSILMDAFHTERPEDVNVCAAVTPTGIGMATFYMFDDTSGRNTLSAEDALSFARNNPQFKITKTVRVPTTTINDIVVNHCANAVWPTFLSCDIEGLDFEVLRSANFTTSKPMVICVESRRDDDRIPLLLNERDYGIYCRMGDNLIFVRSDSTWSSALR